MEVVLSIKHRTTRARARPAIRSERESCRRYGLAAIANWQTSGCRAVKRRRRRHRSRTAAGSKRAKNGRAQILLQHRMAGLIESIPRQEELSVSRRRQPGQDGNIRAKKGVILATGGSTGNVNFRRMFDPRLTEVILRRCRRALHGFKTRAASLRASPIGASLWVCTTRPVSSAQA